MFSITVEVSLGVVKFENAKPPENIIVKVIIEGGRKWEAQLRHVYNQFFLINPLVGTGLAE